MEFDAGETVVTSDEQVGTVLRIEPQGLDRLRYSYYTASAKKPVVAYPVLLDGGEIRVYAEWALRRPDAGRTGQE